MRDIRPVPPSKPDGDIPSGAFDRDDEWEQTSRPMPQHKPIPSPRFIGSKVPVTSVHVLPPKKALRSSERLHTKVATAAPKAPQGPRMRIGHRERTIAIALLALVAIASLLGALLFLPKADIKLTLRTAPLLVDEKLVISAQTDAAGTTTIPGSVFMREVQVTGTSPVTSTQVIGEKAKGTVVIVNRTVEEQKIKEQSRLVTKDGTLFYMTKSLTVPAAEGAPSRAPVEVIASDAGEKGNIAAQRLDFAALDKSSQTLVYAEATSALTGGSGETVPIVKEKDIEAAKEAAKLAARTQVEQQIRGELPKNWAILEESWTTELPDFTTQTALDSREQNVSYSAPAVVRVMAYEQAAVEGHLKQALEQRLEQDYMLFPGPISYNKSIEDVNWDDARANISTRVTHTTIPRFSVESLRSKIAGYSEEEAKKYLEGLPGVRAVSLDLSPFWATSIPRLEKRISLDFQPERQP